MKQLLFSVTRNDLEIETFTVSGCGGQRKDRKEVGVRIRHKTSGATGEGRELRQQVKNKEQALVNLFKSKIFQSWHKLETSRRLSKKSIDQLVDELMEPENIKFEIRDEDGKWKEINYDEIS